jgi:hypothetical protein
VNSHGPTGVGNVLQLFCKGRRAVVDSHHHCVATNLNELNNNNNKETLGQRHLQLLTLQVGNRTIHKISMKNVTLCDFVSELIDNI